MYLNVMGNVHAVCRAIGKPKYTEEVGEKRVELTKVTARAVEMTPDGKQSLTLILLFFGQMAIPAMKIDINDTLVIDGREEVRSTFQRGKNLLERSVLVEAWQPQDNDPCGMAQELKVRREVAVRRFEYRDLMAEFLTNWKPTIIKWVVNYFNELRGKTNSENKNSEKKDADNT